MKLFRTTVFIVDLNKTDNVRTWLRHLFCGAIVAKGMEVVFGHCIIIMMVDQMSLVLLSMQYQTVSRGVILESCPKVWHIVIHSPSTMRGSMLLW